MDGYGHPKILKIYKDITVAKWISAKEEKRNVKKRCQNPQPIDQYRELEGTLDL